MQYESVIGIEVHAQLKTNSKLFCSCSTDFEVGSNHNTCPVCLGLPGTLPVLNKRAIELVIKTGKALNCKIMDFSRFDRKHYYYPDLPKAYQISQYDSPIAVDGYIVIENKKIRINRIHLEEDAGKLMHEDSTSCVDYNRTGMPLMEIVTEPDISSSEEAVVYLETLHSLLRYIGVSDVNMEKGQMRCEPNISIRLVGQKMLGVKTEIKNINSFKAVKLGIDYEIRRQIEVMVDGGTIVQETKRWDNESQSTKTMRSKEDAHDYRYFPDPDLMPLNIDAGWLDSIKMPELPEDYMHRIMGKGITEYAAKVLLSENELIRKHCDQIITEGGNPKKTIDWIINSIDKEEILKIKPKQFIEFQTSVSGMSASNIVNDIYKEVINTGKLAKDIILEKGYYQIDNNGEIDNIIDKILLDNPKVVDDIASGKDKAIGSLIGKVMKELGGKADAKKVGDMIKDRILNG